MTSNHIVRDVAFAMVFLPLGYYCIFQRTKLANAFIYYYKAYRKNNKYVPSEKAVLFITNSVIPTIGVCYLALGVVLLYRVINYFVFQ
jgi:hypothetical protein